MISFLKTTRDRFVATLRDLASLGTVLPGDVEQDLWQAALRTGTVVPGPFRQAEPRRQPAVA